MVMLWDCGGATPSILLLRAGAVGANNKPFYIRRLTTTYYELLPSVMVPLQFVTWEYRFFEKHVTKACAHMNNNTTTDKTSFSWLN